MLGIGLDQLDHRPLLAPLRRVDLHFTSATLREQFFEHGAVFEFDWNVNDRGNVWLVQVNLFEKGREKFLRIEIDLIFPKELSPVYDLARAQVEQIRGHQRRFGIVAENVSIVGFERRHLLLFAHFFHGFEQRVQRRGFFVTHLRTQLLDPLSQIAREIAMAAFKKHPH